jgi:hypothetical protein
MWYYGTELVKERTRSKTGDLGQSFSDNSVGVLLILHLYADRYILHLDSLRLPNSQYKFLRIFKLLNFTSTYIF